MLNTSGKFGANGAPIHEPELLSWKVSENSLSTEIAFPASGEWFSGHFPGFPVLPGVAQLFYFRHFARKAFGRFPETGTYRRVKFRRLVRPGEKVLLEVERKAPQEMSFKMSVDGEIASCGSVEALVGDGCGEPSLLRDGRFDGEELPQSVLMDLLPHRPPMTMLADVLAVDTPGVAVAVADSSPCSVFHDAGLGGVPACAALEYMAQTMALAVGAEMLRCGGRPKIGFVLGTRRLTVSVPVFESGRRYVTVAKCAYSDDEFASFDCEICDSCGELVAAATLTAYQPPKSMLETGAVLLKDGR